MDGFHFPFGPEEKRIVTVFTASRYAGEYQNKAVRMEIARTESRPFGRSHRAFRKEEGDGAPDQREAIRARKSAVVGEANANKTALAVIHDGVFDAKSCPCGQTSLENEFYNEY
jgi:hypothetical protein